jgi:RNA polymerase sigma-70 factor (ECF subfamily)
VDDGSRVTQLLQRWRSGDESAHESLVPLIYEHLRKLAERSLHGERRDHTLRPTALVHEAYLKLVRADTPWNDRQHFFAVAARVMRRILVDHARAHHRQKRGGGAQMVSLEEVIAISDSPPAMLLDLDRALTALKEFDERKASIVELLYFAGLTYEEAAQAIGVSVATLHRELVFSKAWLYREIEGIRKQDADGGDE